MTYDSVYDPDCREWHFLSPALPFLEGEGVVEVTVRVTIWGCVFEDHATGVPLRSDSHNIVV